MPALSEDQWRNVCKIGQGAACCRYLVMGKDFECAKLSKMKSVIDQRVLAGMFTAKGDNCEGIEYD